MDSTQTIEEYISQSDWRINANANTSYSNAGLVNNVAGKIIANYWLDKVYSKEEGYAHRNGDIHIHDLDCLTGYCAGWSLRGLLNEVKRGNGLFGSTEMTGSIGVVTINMARLGYLFAGNKTGLYEWLDYLMQIAKSTLEEKRVFIQEMFDRGLYP